MNGRKDAHEAALGLKEKAHSLTDFGNVLKGIYALSEQVAHLKKHQVARVRRFGTIGKKRKAAPAREDATSKEQEPAKAKARKQKANSAREDVEWSEPRQKRPQRTEQGMQSEAPPKTMIVQSAQSELTRCTRT